MSPEMERPSEAELIARCRKGDRDAWDCLVELLLRTKEELLAGRSHRRRHWPPEVIEDATEDVCRSLLCEPDKRLAKLDLRHRTLGDCLARLLCSRAGVLARAERRRHEHEHAAAVANAPARGEETSRLERLRAILPLLSEHQRVVVTDILEGRIPDGLVTGQEGWFRQLLHRIREVLKEIEGGEA